MQNETSSASKRRVAQEKIYSEIREKLEGKDIDGAEALIDMIPGSARDAEWHFLKGCALTHNGWFHDAQEHFNTAHQLEHDNEEYAEAVGSLESSANGYVDTWSNGSDNETETKQRKSTNGAKCAVCAEGCCECFCEGIIEGICDGI